jgi:hypothetical protein
VLTTFISVGTLRVEALQVKWSQDGGNLTCHCCKWGSVMTKGLPKETSIFEKRVVSLNCRDEFPQTVGTAAPDRATPPGREAERDRTTVRSWSRRDPSVWPPWLA